MAPKTRAQRNKHERTKEAVVIVSSPELPPSTLDSGKSRSCSAVAAGSTDDDIFDIDMDSDLEALIDECSHTEDAPAHSNKRSKSSSTQQPSGHITMPLKRSHSQASNRRAISDRPRFKLARPAAQQQHSAMPTAVPQSLRNVDSSDNGDLVWWQRYEPRTVDELALHAGKTAQVRGWLEMATSGAYGAQVFRLLVLEGPPGTCKSTSIRVLAADMGLEIIEWINPLAERQSVAAEHQDYAEDCGDDMPEGVVRQFDDFLKRAERYSNLELHPGSEGGAMHQDGRRNKIIMIDDLPNVGHRDTRDAFANALCRFVATPASRSFPMVIVVTECFAMHQILGDHDDSTARYRATTSSDDAVWSAADVIPPSVYQSQYCQTIKFNPVAPTIVAKGLKRILQLQEGLQRAAKAHTAMVKRISTECSGDLRLAVTMLQLSMSANRPANFSTVDMGKRSALDLFHALGKVLYAKRTGSGTKGRGALESDPDDILDRVPMDLGTFGLFVHENYVDFCSSVDELADAAEYLSESDAVSTGGAAWSATGARVSGAYAAMIAVRGLMNVRDHPRYAADPDPELEKAVAGKRRHMAAFRKPTFFDSYKRKAAFASVWRDMATGDLGTVGGARDRQSAVLDVLPYWAHIVAVRGASKAQRYSPAYAQLMRLATVGRADASEEATGGYWTAVARAAENTAQQPVHAVAAAEELQKLVLSDDDIDEFSD